MFTDTQMKGKHLVKLHWWCVFIGPDLLEIQIRRALMKNQVPPVYFPNKNHPSGDLIWI